MTRFRFVHFGVAVAVAAVVATSMQLVSASGPSSASVFIPIAPCRLLDTRPAPDNVGARSTPVTAGDVVTLQVWGANGNCTIPTSATGIASNVTAVNPTASSYLTLFPADVGRPLASNLNWVPSSPPTPNQVTVGLSAAGAVSVFNNGGSIDVIIDIVGYYETAPASGGPQGPAGPTGSMGPVGPPNRITDAQIASLKWYQDPGRSATIAVGSNPYGIASDGTYLWVSNYGSDTLNKIDPVTNTVIATVPLGVNARPEGLLFDGSSIWVASSGLNRVSRINPVTNVVTANIVVGTNPANLAMDATGIWVADYTSNDIKRIDPATNTVVATMSGFSQPYGIAFDGTNLFVTNFGASTVLKVNPVARSFLSTIILPGGSNPYGIVYDGTNIWVADNGTNRLSRINPTTGATSNGYNTPELGPMGLAFDGKDLWVIHNDSGSLTKVNPTTGVFGPVVTIGSQPTAVVFDGTNIWTANNGAGTVSKIIPF